MDVMNFKPQLVGDGDVEVFIYNNDAVAVEPKIDGIRILLERKGDDLRFITRNGKDYSSRYLSIVDNLRKGLHINDVVLDGEIAVVKDGKVMGPHRAISKKLEKGEKLVYFVFDVLEIDGHDLTELDYVNRRLHIGLLVEENESLSIIPNTFTNTIVDVQSLYKKFIESGFEGLVVKNLEEYRPNSRFNWIKLKPIRTRDVRIIEKKKTKDEKAFVYKYLTEEEKEGTVMSKDDYKVGSVIELSFNKGNFEKLRFPRIVRVRDDKD